MLQKTVYKQFVQVSGLCGPQFTSYLPKHFTHHCRDLYTNMAAENQQKHLEFTFSIKSLSFHSRASIHAHKHIFYYLKWLNCLKSRGEAFFQLDSIPILVSRTVKTQKFKLLQFQNETCYGTRNLYKDLFFVYFNLVLMRIRKTSLF